MGDEAIPRDYEKEYLDTFTKKILFPIIKHEFAWINPAIESVVYTMTTVSINKDVKFELYTQSDTYNQLIEIKEKLVAERNNKGSKKVEEVKETGKNKKDTKKDILQNEILTTSVKAETPIVEDLTELALCMLEDNRATKNKEEEKKRQKDNESKNKKVDYKKKENTCVLGQKVMSDHKV